MDLRDIGWGDMDCIYVAQDREEWMTLVITIRKLLVSNQI
jgi:hypothetical protein